MSQHWIWINSAGYRRFVEASREKRSLLYVAGAALSGALMFAGYVVANATNPDFEAEGYKSKQAELAKLPLQSQVCVVSCGCSVWGVGWQQLQAGCVPCDGNPGKPAAAAMTMAYAYAS